MIKMIKSAKTKEVADEKLVKDLEKQGWERADAPVKSTLRAPKKFTDVLEDESEPAEATPAKEEASNLNAINKGD